METMEKQKERFVKRRRRRVDELENTYGLPATDTRAIENTYGRGIRDGTVHFTPGEDGGGTLTTQFIKDGNLQKIEIDIPEGPEAIFLAGLQAGARQQ